MGRNLTSSPTSSRPRPGRGDVVSHRTSSPVPHPYGRDEVRDDVEQDRDDLVPKINQGDV